MARKNRLNLKSNFRTGDRPTEEDFADVFDSYVNFKDDNVKIDENSNLEIGGALTLASNGNEPEKKGTIRWNDSEGEFEGHNGSEWGPLGGGESPWLKESGNLVFRGGKVGIGTPNEVSNKLEVEQGPNEKSRFGTVTLGSGEGPYSSWAILTHKERIKYEQFAFAQAQTGRIAINCGNDGNIPRDEKIEFMFNNSTQGAWVNNNLVIGSASELSGADSSHKLQINGSAIKNDGKADWDTISDIRTKENIKDFKQGLNIIKKLDPISFSYNGFAGTPEGRQAIGVNAQELEKIFPSMVQRNALNKKHSHEDATELLTTNLSALKFIMVNAIKELDKRIESLENQSNNQSNNNIE